MRNELFRKGLVCAIVVLFIGIAIIPSIHAEVSKTNFVQKKTDDIPPVAVAGGPYNGESGDVIVLDGSDSYDPDGTIVEWYWYYSIGLGPIRTLPTPIGFGETIEYSWDSHLISFIHLCLRVTDNDGATDCDETTVVIIRNPVSNQQLSIGSQSSKSVLPSTGNIVAEKYVSTDNQICKTNSDDDTTVKDSDIYSYSSQSAEIVEKSSMYVGDPSCYPVINGTMGENGWYVSDVMITFVGDCTYVEYKINDGPWQTYTGPFMVTEDGIYTLCWYAIDSQGNISEGCIDFKIDQTPPTIDLTVEKIGVTRLLIAADVSDETSGVNRVELSVYVNWTMGHKHIFLICYEEPYEWILSLYPALGWLVKIEAKATVYDNAGNLAEDEESVSYSHSQSQSSNRCPQSSSNDQLPYAPLFCEPAHGSYIDTVESGQAGKDIPSPGRPILVVEFLSGNRVKITNIGTATAYNVHLKLELQGGFVLIGRVREIVIDEIEPDESVIRDLGRVFGFGRVILVLSVWADNVPKVEDSAHGILIGFFLKLTS